MLEPVAHDERTFAEWRDDFVGLLEVLSKHASARADLNQSRDERRKAHLLLKLALLIRQET